MLRRVVGIDPSPKLIQRARRRIDWSNVEAQKLDATNDSLGQEEFDAALAMHSLSAMPHADAVLDGIYTALKPGGRTGRPSARQA